MYCCLVRWALSTRPVRTCALGEMERGRPCHTFPQGIASPCLEIAVGRDMNKPVRAILHARRNEARRRAQGGAARKAESIRTSRNESTEQKNICHSVRVMGKWKPHDDRIHLCKMADRSVSINQSFNLERCYTV